jgi:nucleotide-binding universal stress UspA family protein
MSYKDILVHVDNTHHCAARLALAGHLAAARQAHLIALNVRTSLEVPQYITAQFGGEIDAIRLRYEAEAARQAKAMVEALDFGPGVGTEWRDVEGALADSIALHARYADLTVIGQPAPDDDGGDVAGRLVLDVGRPVLVVPYAGRFAVLGERVLVAWNGSREATRAVHDALPILKGAKLVHVIAVNPEGGMTGHGDIPGADICLHLSRHGVNAVCEHVKAEDLGVGEMLLSRAADEDVDLIVMGAYGRSRVRELVMGGTTRHLLRHMTVPVLMSH